MKRHLYSELRTIYETTDADPHTFRVTISNIIMGGVVLDINPISQEQRGSLSEYLTGVETYLAEKQAQMAREAVQTVMQDEKKQPKVVVTYTVAECGEFHSQGAYHKGIATIEEAKAIYEAIPEEYRDSVTNWETQVHNIADDIRSGNSADYKQYLGAVVSQSDNIEDVPKAEERKEARNAEQERIEEEERKRRARGERPSLRARLEEKKAIVAVGGVRPQHEKQRQAQREAVASQRNI